MPRPPPPPPPPLQKRGLMVPCWYTVGYSIQTCWLLEYQHGHGLLLKMQNNCFWNTDYQYMYPPSVKASLQENVAYDFIHRIKNYNYFSSLHKCRNLEVKEENHKITHLEVAVWFCWCEGHWDWEEVSWMSWDAKLHAPTFIGWINDRQLPLKNRMLMIIVVFTIHFSNNWSTNTMPTIGQ